MPLFNAVKGIADLKTAQVTDPNAVYKNVSDLDAIRGGAAEITGASEEIEQANTEAGTMDRLALEAKAMAAEQAGNLAEAESIRAGIIQQGYTDAQAQVTPWAGIGDASLRGYEQQVLAPGQEFGTEAGNQFQQQAAIAPQSQYFDQAAQTAMSRPSRLEDIEGYGLMQQARDEALQASGQQFAGQGKFMSGSRIAEAGNIGSREAQGLIAQDDFRRQQNVQNLMGFGAQDVANTQQGFQNLGAAAQQGLGVQQMNYGSQQGQLDRQRDLMGFGYGVDQRAGDLAVQEAQQLGQGGYSSAQDQANLLMGGQAQSAGLTQAGSGFRMGGAQAEGAVMTDLLQFGGKLAGGIMGGGGQQGGGGINYGGGYSNDDYLRY